MNGAGAKALRPTGGRSIGRLLRQLATLWKAPALTDITVVLNPRLSRTLGRLAGRPWRIELGPRALASSKRLREVVTHETAHAALATNGGATRQAPPPLYDHWCPVCQSSRVGRRPVKAWRCAACVAAGLDGKLEITRRATKPAKAR